MEEPLETLAKRDLFLIPVTKCKALPSIRVAQCKQTTPRSHLLSSSGIAGTSLRTLLPREVCTVKRLGVPGADIPSLQTVLSTAHPPCSAETAKVVPGEEEKRGARHRKGRARAQLFSCNRSSSDGTAEPSPAFQPPGTGRVREPKSSSLHAALEGTSHFSPCWSIFSSWLRPQRRQGLNSLRSKNMVPFPQTLPHPQV